MLVPEREREMGMWLRWEELVGAEVERTAVDPGGLEGDWEAVRGLLVIGGAEGTGGAEARGAGRESREEDASESQLRCKR